MTDKYRIDPDFVVPEPTAAEFFCYWALEEYSDEKRAEVLREWRENGVKQARITLVNDEYPHEPYPHGYWLEGWTDKRARMLPFGEAETPDGPCWPALTYGNDKLALAAGSGTAETNEDSAQCEASQSGGAKTPHRPEQSA